MDGEDWIETSIPVPQVRLIRLARPAKRNALTNAMVCRLGALLAADAADPGIRCAVLTGDDAAFSAGADIAELHRQGAAAVGDPARAAAWHRIETFPKPLIGAVNGLCYGAGNELAMLCDFVIAGRNARFAQPEVAIGGMPGDGGTQRLPRHVGRPLAAFMMMTGEPIDAEAALRAGLVVAVTAPEETVGRAIAIASRIAAHAPLAVEAVKACLAAGANAGLDAGLGLERAALWRLTRTADWLEGVAAFVEKRPPRFTGRLD